ncbi:MAG: class I SAM-dependent methyltransferase [Gammaproteobacteria bacterium]
MKTDAQFWDGVSSKYSAKPVPDESIYEQKLAISRKYLKPDHQVMEFGCGTGTTALKHAGDVEHIIAYDFSPEMIKIAKSKQAAQANVDNVEFKVAAVEDIEFGNDQFDAIMGHSILHLTFDNEVTLKKIFNGLKPGGVFISGSGCLKEMNPLIRMAIPIMQFFGKAPAVNAFSSSELVNLHTACGFEIVERWDYKKGELYLVAQKPE